MLLSTRVVLHVTVIGVALTTAAVRPADAASSWSMRPITTVQVPVAPAAAPAVRAVRAVRAAPAARAVRAVSKSRLVRHRHHASTPTGWAQLDAAIARISSYHRGAARWVVSDRYGHWGTTDWYHDTLYISPGVPTAYVYDVAVHEWSHELSVLDYNGNVAAAVSAMNRHFGGAGLTGAERAADCMAILQGASWTHYTRCTDPRWRAGARVLLRGGEL